MMYLSIKNKICSLEQVILMEEGSDAWLGGMYLDMSCLRLNILWHVSTSFELSQHVAFASPHLGAHLRIFELSLPVVFASPHLGASLHIFHVISILFRTLTSSFINQKNSSRQARVFSKPI